MGEKVEAPKRMVSPTTATPAARGDDYVRAQLLQRAHSYQPPFDLLALDPEGGVATSPVGFAVDKHGALVMEAEAVSLWWARGRGFANLALKRDPNFQVFNGPVEVAITGSSMIVLARDGETKVGDVGLSPDPPMGRVGDRICALSGR
jgi:hypothetical protein